MSIMKTKGYLASRKIEQLFFLILFSFFLLFPPIMSRAEEEVGSPPLQGEVKKISVNQGFLVVKPTEGKRQKIFFTKDTVFKGVLLATEIQKKQKVKIWYVVENDLVKALRIEVKPELGC